MNKFILSKRSLDRLKTVNIDLQKVVEAAIGVSGVDFAVLEGLRTVERQRALVLAGASQTMDSRHLTGHAVDLVALVDGKVTWQPKIYHFIADAMLVEAAKLHIPIIWGGSWRSFPDLVHFELNRKFYP